MHAQRTLLKLLYIQACDIRYLILQIEHNACLARCLQALLMASSVAVSLLQCIALKCRCCKVSVADGIFCRIHLQIELNACLMRCSQGIANGIFCRIHLPIVAVAVSLLQCHCCSLL